MPESPAAPGAGLGKMEGPLLQSAVAASLTLIASLTWFFLPLRVAPVAPLGIGLGLLAVAMVLRRPLFAALPLFVFATFKLDEAYPQLSHLKPVPLASALTLFAVWWHVSFSRTISPRFRPEIGALLFFFAIVTFEVIFALNVKLAFERWWEFARVVFLTVGISWIIRSHLEFRLTTFSIIASGILVSLVAIANKLSGVGLVEGTRVTVGWTGFLSNPNDLALVLLFPLAAAASQLFFRPAVSTLALGAFGVLIIGWAIVLTQSRGALLGIIAMFGVVAWIRIRSKFLVIAGAVVVGFSLYALMGIDERKSGGAADKEDPSATIRKYAWQAGTSMALTRVTGVGLDNFEEQFPYYTPVPVRGKYVAHSIWFQVLGETGFPGLLGFVCMIAFCVRESWRNVRALSNSAEASLALAVLAGYTGFCVSGSFGSYAFDWPLYALIALTASLSCSRTSADSPYSGSYPAALK